MNKLKFKKGKTILNAVDGNKIELIHDGYPKKEAKRYFKTKKESYGNENIDFQIPAVFIGHALHTIQQGVDKYLKINGIKVLGAANSKDTSGEPIECSVLLDISFKGTLNKVTYGQILNKGELIKSVLLLEKQVYKIIEFINKD